jgi:hypothetical protein
VQVEEAVLGEDRAEQRTAHVGEAEGGAVEGERLGPLVLREHDHYDGDDLRHHQCRGDALGEPGGDQHAGRRGRATGDRGHGEAGDADEEDALAAEDVAEPAAGDEHQREGQRVAGEDPLRGRVSGVEVGLDARQGDADDGAVDEVHESGGEHEAERQPAALDRAWRRLIDGHVGPSGFGRLKI